MARCVLAVLLAGAHAGPTALLGLRSRLRRAQEAQKENELPITAESPDNILNVGNYAVAQPTPEAAFLDGMYCRGGACQYRTGAPPPLISPTPPVPIIYPASNRDFCRGFSCSPGMGVPENPAMNKFKFDCAHLYNDLGGMSGKDGQRNLEDVKASFFNWCKLKFPPHLVENCNGLGDVVIMAMHARTGSPNVGGAAEICGDTFLSIGMWNQAKVDLKLMPGAFPTPPAFLTQETKLAKVFLPADLEGQDPSEVGPETRRGKAWAALQRKMGRIPKGAVSLYDFQGSPAKPNFLEEKAHLDPAYKPDYDQSPPCIHGIHKGAHSYTIDQNIPPTEVEGKLYEFCVNEFGEIMSGFAQTGEMVTTMTKDWCNWQSSATSWVGDADITGHPEWDFRRCNGMKALVAFALHNDLDKGLGAADVCNRVFLTLGAIEWHEGMVKTAWEPGPLRVIKTPGLSTAPDPNAKKLLEEAQEYANKMFSKLRGQKEQFNDLNNAKMDDAAFALHSKAKLRKPKPAPPPPPLPTDMFSELDRLSQP